MLTIVTATVEDVPAIVSHRRAMFAAMGYGDAAKLNAMASAFEPWLREKMAASEYLARLAVTPSRDIAAGIGLWLMDWPPHMIGSGARRGNILNVFVRPENRRQGIASQLMHIVLDWCAANRIDHVMLHASPEGRSLYESLGFAATNEMCLIRS